MTTWWWVRHGPTHERSFVGWRDVPADLSDRATLMRLSAFLPARAALVSSDLARSHATADKLAGPGRVRLPDAQALREFDFGRWDGVRFDEIARRDPDLSRRFWEEPGAVAAPEGESWNDVATRVAGFVEALNGVYEHVIAVAHIGVIMTQLARASGMAPAEVIGARIEPLSLTRIEMTGHGWQVHEVNHLP